MGIYNFNKHDYVKAFITYKAIEIGLTLILYAISRTSRSVFGVCIEIILYQDYIIQNYNT